MPRRASTTHNRPFKVIGLMSGTSTDGISACLAEIHPPSPKDSRRGGGGRRPPPPPRWVSALSGKNPPPSTKGRPRGGGAARRAPTCKSPLPRDLPLRTFPAG